VQIIIVPTTSLISSFDVKHLNYFNISSLNKPVWLIVIQSLKNKVTIVPEWKYIGIYVNNGKYAVKPVFYWLLLFLFLRLKREGACCST